MASPQVGGPGRPRRLLLSGMRHSWPALRGRPTGGDRPRGAGAGTGASGSPGAGSPDAGSPALGSPAVDSRFAGSTVAGSTVAGSPVADADLVDADRLSWWEHAWRLAVVWIAGMLLWVAVGSFVAGSWGEDMPPVSPAAPALLVIDLVLGHVAVAVAAFRRRRPVGVAVTTGALTLLSMSATPAALLALTSLATRRRLPVLLLVSAFQLSAALVAEAAITPLLGLRSTGSGDSLLVDLSISAVFVTLIHVVFALVGWNAGSRRELVRSWRTQARTAHSEQAARVSQARLAERARIAREMHDVLAHRLSLVAMHAGVLAHRTDLPEDDRRAAAEIVRAGAHQALEELREVLGVLRDDGDGPQAVEAPQPGLSAIPTLVAEVTSSGQHVTLEADPQLWALSVSLPASTGRHAYRVVQESLTNARKHAPGAAVAVALAGGPSHGLTLAITNPLGRAGRSGAAPTGDAVAGEGLDPREGVGGLPSGGQGLTGMAERVQLAGGRFEAGAQAGRFAVRAWLPWPARDAVPYGGLAGSLLSPASRSGAAASSSSGTSGQDHVSTMGEQDG